MMGAGGPGTAGTPQTNKTTARRQGESKKQSSYTLLEGKVGSGMQTHCVIAILARAGTDAKRHICLIITTPLDSFPGPLFALRSAGWCSNRSRP